MYHSARKLRQFVRKITVKDGLLGLKFAFPTLMAGISVTQLGLDEAELATQKPVASSADIPAKAATAVAAEAESTTTATTAATTAVATTATATATPTAATTTTAPSGPYDEEGNMLVEIDRPEALLLDEDLKIEWIRMEKEEKAKGKGGKAGATSKLTTTTTTKPAWQDGVLPREVITTWMNGVAVSGAAKGKRATAISNPRVTRPAEAVLPRREASQGLTSLAIVNPDNAAVHVDPNGEALYRPPAPMRGAAGDNAAMNSAISMKQTLGRLVPGSAGGPVTTTLACFKEDRRNFLKPVSAATMEYTCHSHQIQKRSFVYPYNHIILSYLLYNLFAL